MNEESRPEEGLSRANDVSGGVKLPGGRANVEEAELRSGEVGYFPRGNILSEGVDGEASPSTNVSPE